MTKPRKLSDSELRIADLGNQRESSVLQIRDPQSEIILSLLSSLDDFPVLVVTAMRTGAMRHTQLVTIGTFREGSRGQMIVCPATIAPRL